MSGRPESCAHRTALASMAAIGATLVAAQWLSPTAVHSQAARAALAAPAWQDPSPHRLQMVTVEAGVQLEVLDWGGSGPPIVLLAGSGNTAHVFDDFALRLTGLGRVVGVTRRGFGASSAPAVGYTTERLGEDVLQVIAALDLPRPIVVGHSIAGQELSWLASRHADRLRALVYLDAAYRYAFHRPGILENVRDLRQRLERLEAEIAGPPRPPAELARAIDGVMGESLGEVLRDLEDLRTTPGIPGTPPAPSEDDLRSVAAYQDWSRRVMGYATPEAEIRLQRTITAEGAVGAAKPQAAAARAMAVAGAERFTSVGLPALIIYASPRGLGPWADGPGVDRTRVDDFSRFDEGMTERQARWVARAVPSARVVRIRQASHYPFLSHADDVVREMTTFVRGLQ